MVRIRIAVVIGVFFALLVGVPHASAITTRTISVHVTVNGIIEPGTGIAAWPAPPLVPFNQRNGSNGIFAEVNASGDATITVDDSIDYYAYATADNFTQYSPPIFSNPGVFVAAAATPASLGNIDFTLAGRTYSGQVTRTGFTTFAFHTAGVGACPYPALTPAVRADGYCNGLRFTWTDLNGNYLLRLGPNAPGTSWNVAGFLFIDGRPVIGPVVNLIVPTGNTTEARNFNSDVNATPAPSQPVGPIGNQVTIASAGGVLNVASVPSSTTPVPNDVTFANGVISFTAQVAQGGTADIRMTFVDPLPTNAHWYKLRNGIWSVYPNTIIDPLDDHTLIISVTDGDPAEDDDGIVNGYVTDPGALGVPTNPPLNKDQCKKDGWQRGLYRNQGECVSHFTRH